MKKKKKIIGIKKQSARDIKVYSPIITEEHIGNYEAVKRKVFTVFEMIGVIECFQSDLSLLFWVIDKNKGQKLIDKLEEFKLDFQYRYENYSLRALYQHHHQKLFSFITKKISEINLEIIESKITPLKTAKGNKDLLLNQEQIVILFQYLQKINVFDSTQKLNTKMSMALNLLTGWDENKMRILFSENKDSNDRTHKGKVVIAVKKLLSSLEQEK